MEYLAKILYEERHENLWRYDFLKLETSNKGQFCNRKKGYAWKYFAAVFRVNERTLCRRIKQTCRILQQVGENQKLLAAIYHFM